MSGPPELPGLMAASVWMPSLMVAPLGDCRSRPVADTTPNDSEDTQAERIADGDDLLADDDLDESPKGIGVSDRRLARVDLQQRDVGRLVHADDRRRDLRARVLERHRDLAGRLPLSLTT